jgi:uncharacterized damage-inducible protein DinB
VAEDGGGPPAERRRRPRVQALPARVRDLLAALRGAVEQEGWHGPTVLESVRGVSGVLALRKPAGAHHSVVDLVQHIAYWEAIGLHHVSGGTVPKPVEADWTEPPTSLALAVKRLRSTHAALVAAVARMPEDLLDRRVPTDEGPRPLADVLHGVAAHGTYHAGQIRLLLTLGRETPPARQTKENA